MSPLENHILLSTAKYNIAKVFGISQADITGVLAEDGSGKKFLFTYCSTLYFIDFTNKSFHKIN